MICRSRFVKGVCLLADVELFFGIQITRAQMAAFDCIFRHSCSHSKIYLPKSISSRLQEACYVPLSEGCCLHTQTALCSMKPARAASCSGRSLCVMFCATLQEATCRNGRSARVRACISMFQQICTRGLRQSRHFVLSCRLEASLLVLLSFLSCTALQNWLASEPVSRNRRQVTMCQLQRSCCSGDDLETMQDRQSHAGIDLRNQQNRETAPKCNLMGQCSPARILKSDHLLNTVA